MQKICVLIIFFMAACKPVKKPNAQEAASKVTMVMEKLSYQSVLNSISKTKLQFDNSNDYLHLEQFFVSAIADSIFPCWYGTRWDFNGTTQQPGSGSIACGYFVATVLQQAGVPLNRVKVGQSASQIIIEQFAAAKQIKKFSRPAMDDLTTVIQQMGQGLYIVGLDFHTGFVWYDGKDIWFVHARYNGPRAVVKETFATSAIIRQSAFVMLGKISENKVLLKKWVSARKS